MRTDAQQYINKAGKAVHESPAVAAQTGQTLPLQLACANNFRWWVLIEAHPPQLCTAAAISC